MKSMLLSILIGIITFTSVQAQFGYGNLEDVQQIQKVPLFVVLMSSDDKRIKMLSKKEEGKLELYLAGIEAYNTIIDFQLMGEV